MSLHSVLQRFRERGLSKNRSNLPLIPAVHEISIAIAERFDAKGKVPSREDLHTLLQRFAAAHGVGSLEQFSRREWSKVIWGIWDSTYPLSPIEGFWTEFRTFLRNSGRRTHYKNLILTYLRDFDESELGFQHAGQLIREFLGTENQKDWLWTRRHAALRLFDPASASRLIASFLVQSKHSPDAALAETGCRGVAAGGGLERSAFGQALKDLHQHVRTNTQDATQLRRILTWATKDGDLRYSSMRVDLAESLLLPWRKTQPGTEIQKDTVSFLLRFYRDPRLHRSRWHGVSEPAQQVIRRWLTKATLDQFITVVTRVAQGSHWKYRQAFWMSYYDRNLIDDAWVLFGADARGIVRRAMEEAAGFGHLYGGLSNHCVLMIRIGGLTIADWSHSGKCRIWNSDNDKAPALYKNYRADDLSGNTNFEQAHQGSERHTWQESIARYIRDKTGSWIPMSERVLTKR